MKDQNENLVDVTRLHTLRSYSEKFNVPYPTLYSRYNSVLAGKSKKQLNIVKVCDIDMIYVSKEEEMELLNNIG